MYNQARFPFLMRDFAGLASRSSFKNISIGQRHCLASDRIALGALTDYCNIRVKLENVALTPDVLYCIAKLLRNCTLNALILTNRYFAETLWLCLYDDEIQFRETPCRKDQGYGDYFRRFIERWKSDIMLAYLRGKTRDALSKHDRKGIPFFHHVIFKENLRVAEILLAQGVDVNILGGETRPLLLISDLYSLPEEVANFLIDHGANVMATAGNKVAYIKAAKRGSVAVLEKVLSKLKIQQESSNSTGGHLPADYIDQLFHAVLYVGGVEKARLLLGQGARHSHELDWSTPLMKAVLGGHDDEVNLLLDVGADITLIGPYELPRYGATVLSAIEITKCRNATVRRLIKIVTDGGGDITIPGSRIAAMTKIDEDHSIFFLNYPWRLNYRTPLQNFLRAKNLAMVKALIQNGAVAKATPQRLFYTIRDSHYMSRHSLDPVHDAMFCELFIAMKDRPDFDLRPYLNANSLADAPGKLLHWFAYCTFLMYRPYVPSYLRDDPSPYSSSLRWA